VDVSYDQIENKAEKPASPFKFNHVWLQDEAFQQLVLENWHFSCSKFSRVCFSAICGKFKAGKETGG
jgi:hypothetical protein